MRCVFIVALSCALVSCGVTPGPLRNVEWKTFPDGSKAYFSEDSHHPQVERCWPTSTGFDCLLLSGIKFNDGGTTWRAERRHADALEPGQLSFRGYSCRIDESHLLGQRFDETIAASPSQDLLKNDVRVGSPSAGWTAAFVRDFMRSNGVGDGTQYFNCEALEALIDAGSGATLATTAASRAALFS